MINISKKIIILFLLIIYSSISHASTEADFNKIDKMLKKGYITKSECVKLKSEVMGRKLPKTICDKVKKVSKSKGINFPQFQISSHINKLFSGNGLFVIIIAILLFVFYLIRSSLSNFFISFFKGLSKYLKIILSNFFNSFSKILSSYSKKRKKLLKITSNIKKQKTSKPLFSVFKLKQKTLVVPALLIIILFLGIDRFTNININMFAKDEFKNVNPNSLSADQKRVYMCVKSYGFKKGTEGFRNCVFKLVQAELDLKRLEAERKIAEAQIKAAREANQQAAAQMQAEREAMLRAQQEQRQAEAWSDLGQLGLMLLQTPQPQSRTNCSWFGHQWKCETW